MSRFDEITKELTKKELVHVLRKYDCYVSSFGQEDWTTPVGFVEFYDMGFKENIYEC